jgi:hypothetical protein
MLETKLYDRLVVKTVIDNRLLQLNATIYNLPIIGGYYFQILRLVLDHKEKPLANNLNSLKTYVRHLHDCLFNELYIPVDYHADACYNLIHIGDGYKSDDLIAIIADDLHGLGYSVDFISKYIAIVTSALTWYTSDPVTQFAEWNQNINECINLLNDGEIKWY